VIIFSLTMKIHILITTYFLYAAPPKIDELASSPKRVNVKEGENAELRCEVTGTPTPEIHWYRGSSETRKYILIYIIYNNIYFYIAFDIWPSYSGLLLA
jgi:hypothetical protein